MNGFLIGLLVGIGAATLVALVIALASSRRFPLFGRCPGGAVEYRKVMVASLGSPFSRGAIDLAAHMAGKAGLVQTVYLAEIPLNQPLESGAESDVARGLEALEIAAKLGTGSGIKVLPRLKKTRLGSKSIVEIQQGEGFDAVILEVKPRGRSQRVGRKLAEYVQEHVTCAVIVMSEGEDD